MTQTNEELIKAFKNHLDYYKDLKDKWEFLKTPEDRAFHAGKTQGMLLGLEVIERISIPQPEQLEVEIYFSPDQYQGRGYYTVRFEKTTTLFGSADKQACLDFCKRFNLKVTNEPEGGVK